MISHEVANELSIKVRQFIGKSDGLLSTLSLNGNIELARGAFEIAKRIYPNDRLVLLWGNCDQHVRTAAFVPEIFEHLVLTVRFAGMYPALHRGRYMPQALMGSADQWPYRSTGSRPSAPAQDALIQAIDRVRPSALLSPAQVSTPISPLGSNQSRSASLIVPEHRPGDASNLVRVCRYGHVDRPPLEKSSQPSG